MSHYPAQTKYTDDAASHYATGRFDAAVAAREDNMARRLLARCEPFTTVLDAPCGTGRMTGLVAGREVTVLDLSPSMLALAMQTHNVPGLVGAIESLPFPDNSFDLVLSIRFLHHLPDEETFARCLGELARVTKKHVLVTYYEAIAFQQLRRSLKRWLRGRDSHRYARTYGSLRRHAAKVGLRPVARLCSAPFFSEQWFVLLEKTETAAHAKN